MINSIRATFVIVALLLASGCDGKESRENGRSGTADERRGPARLELIRAHGREGVVLPAEPIPWYTQEPETEPYKPTAQQIRAFESGLTDYLKRELPRRPQIAAKHRDYKRQYRGTDHPEQGKRLIAFLMCEPVEGWRIGPVNVWDGGDCYFHVTFDPERDEYVGVSLGRVQDLPPDVDGAALLEKMRNADEQQAEAWQR